MRFWDFTELLSEANVPEKLSDTQLLKKFAIKNCYVRLENLKSDEYNAVVIKSSQKITGFNRPFDLNKEFQSSHFSGKQNKHEIRINPTCNTKRSPSYETSPDIITDRVIPFIIVSSDSEEEVCQEGYRRGKSDPRKHTFCGELMDDEFEKKRRMKCPSNSKVFKRCNKNNINVKSDMWEKQHKQNTPVQAINDGDIAKHLSPSETKTSQLHLNNRNGSNPKVLRRKRSNQENNIKAQTAILEKQKKCHKRNVQNEAVEAVKNEIEKEGNTDNILIKKYGLKNCYVAIPRLPEIPQSPQSNPSKECKKLQDLNHDCKENHTGKHSLIFVSPQDIKVKTMQNDDNDVSSYVSSKPCESLQSRLPVNSPPTPKIEKDCIPYQLALADSNNHTGLRDALKGNSRYAQTPLIRKRNDDARKNNSFGAANERNPPSLREETPPSMAQICEAFENLNLDAENE